MGKNDVKRGAKGHPPESGATPMSFSLDRQEFSAMIRQARTALLSLNRAANQELAASAVESAADGPSVESERHRSRMSGEFGVAGSGED